MRLPSAVLCAFVLASGTALAGRPLATEDAGVLDRGECEIESFAGRARVPQASSVHTLYAQVGCGVGGNTQLAAGLGREREAGTRAAIAALAGKTALRPLTDDTGGWTLAYSMQATRLPRGSLRGSASELRAVLTVPARGWLVHANLGPAYDHRVRQWSTLYGVALERPGALGPVDLMGEVFGTDREGASAQLGVRWGVRPERLFLDASVGRSFRSSGERLVSIGLKYAF